MFDYVRKSYLVMWENYNWWYEREKTRSGRIWSIFVKTRLFTHSLSRWLTSSSLTGSLQMSPSLSAFSFITITIFHQRNLESDQWVNISVDFYFWAQKSNFTFIVWFLFDGHLLLRLSSITCVISTLTWTLLTSSVPIQQKVSGMTSRIENFTCQEYLSRVEGRWWESKPPQTGWPTVPT